MKGRRPALNGKTFKKPCRPYEERFDSDLKMLGNYGLQYKRELLMVQYNLNRIRNTAKDMLTMRKRNPIRIFEIEALMCRLVSNQATMELKLLGCRMGGLLVNILPLIDFTLYARQAAITPRCGVE
ncbi:hypothetical protein HPP92_002347 [Vanilla planifolia]|uniref:Ribosomal protein S4 n=1 Tax=Vanilla planifolia TaxID=51239 RepID=A0A835S045_VANPL|nr:hypothetical protein HPP92_002347 [Vanilla planifolia]